MPADRQVLGVCSRRMPAILLTVLVLSTSTKVPAQESSTASYAVEEGFGSGPISIKARLYRPAGESTAPGVIVLHGCPGPTGATFDWAKRIAAWGYVAIVPDSFGSRGKANVCNDPMVMLPGTRVLDVVAAAEYLATLPFVQRDRIALIGFSHGAGTVMDALQGNLSSVGIRGGIAYYPLCIPEKHTEVAMPLLIVIGDKDDWAPADRCRALQQAGIRHSDLTEIIYYPDTHHGFDVNTPSHTVSGASLSSQDGGTNDLVQHHIEYNAAAAHDAEARTLALFKKLLK